MPDDHTIELALHGYRTGRFPSLNAAARAYKLVPSTLKYRNKKNINRRDSHTQQQLLSPAQEDYLIRWIVNTQTVGTALTHAQVRAMASVLVRSNGGPQQVGKGWVPRFLKRHPSIRPKQD